jgi:hypothetical protein
MRCGGTGWPGPPAGLRRAGLSAAGGPWPRLGFSIGGATVSKSLVFTFIKMCVSERDKEREK